ncbi:Putative Zn-dependent protease, contains TPR repeats [Providencia rustigianii]|nr:Putative Zn-dependent protease, contains TPR repeats [Providencia rustigianii]
MKICTMTKKLKYPLLAVFMSALIHGAILPAYSSVEDTLPDIGTTAGGTLSINQEIIMGDAITRQIRGSTPLIYDPLLTQYINKLGQRLVTNADSVKTPFKFYLVNNPNINAYAYFGGNVVLHSALFRYSQNESQLASVMAHEISHVTQRHLARMMEDQKATTPLAIAGTIGSLLLVMANPQAGFAALTGTMAGMQQGMISFTQANEQEADRIGLQTLRRSGFDPHAMADFMQIMSDQTRYMSKPPEILLTHPLPDSRLADARNRSNQYPKVSAPSSLDFMLARVRILSMYSADQKIALDQILDNYSKGNAQEQLAAKYGQALQLSQDKKYAEAGAILSELLAKQPDNPWFIDSMTDIDIEQKQVGKAVTRLQNALKKSPKNTVFIVNLANAYVNSGQYQDASKLLNKYTFDYPDDPIGWDLLAEASAKQGDRNAELAAYAEGMALRGNYDTAINYLSEASRRSRLGSYDQLRFDARIDELTRLKERDSNAKP